MELYSVFVAECCGGPSTGLECPCGGVGGGAHLDPPTARDVAEWRRLGHEAAADEAAADLARAETRAEFAFTGGLVFQARSRLSTAAAEIEAAVSRLDRLMAELAITPPPGGAVAMARAAEAVWAEFGCYEAESL